MLPPLEMSVSLYYLYQYTQKWLFCIFLSCLMFALQSVDCNCLFALCVCFIETCHSGLPKGRILSSVCECDHELTLTKYGKVLNELPDTHSLIRVP